MEHSSPATPFETFDRPLLSALLEAVDNVTPVYAYSEAYLLQQINTLKTSFQ